MISKHTFRSFKHRNFRIYFLGQLISLNGTWMQSVAQSWLIYRLTESGFMLGLVGSLTLLPNLLFGIYGGWLADRFPRLKLLFIMQLLAMLQALTLGILALGGWIEPWHILLLALALGLVQAIETPVRQSFIVQLIAREDLPNAIALSSSMVHLARFVGPAIAGLLVALAGEGVVFLINAVTYCAVFISLFALRLPARPVRRDAQKNANSMWSGVHYVWQNRLIFFLLTLIAAVSLLGGATMVLMPVFVAEVFKHGSESLGLFMGMLGAGALTGALLLANRREFQLLERRIAIAAVAVAVSLIVFALNDNYYAAILILYVIGFASTTVYASSNALIQLLVPDYLRGRIMALFAICMQGMVSIGQLILGTLSDLLGAPRTTEISGGILFFISLALVMVLFRQKNDTAAEPVPKVSNVDKLK